MAKSNSHSDYSCLSLWPLDMPAGHLITWASMTAILSLITIVVNALLIYSLFKTKQLGSITSKFIILMNISDLCTGVFVLPMVVALIITKKDFRSCAFELVTQYFAFLLAYFSFFMLLSVSIDRYIHVTKLNQYNRFMNEFRMKVIAAVSFVVSAVIAYISVICPSFPLQLILNLSDLTGVLLMFLLYTSVFRKINFHAENFKRMLGDVSISKANREMKHELSATKTIRVLLGTLLVLYFPYNIASAVWTYYKFNRRIEPPLKVKIATYVAYLMVFGNAAVNAIIFGFGNQAVRRIVLSKFPLIKMQVAASEMKDTK